MQCSPFTLDVSTQICSPLSDASQLVSVASRSTLPGISLPYHKRSPFRLFLDLPYQKSSPLPDFVTTVTWLGVDSCRKVWRNCKKLDVERIFRCIPFQGSNFDGLAYQKGSPFDFFGT